MTAAGMILGTAAYMSPSRRKASRPTSAATSGPSVRALRDACGRASVQRRRRGGDARVDHSRRARLECSSGDPGRAGHDVDPPMSDKNARQRRQSIADIRVELEQIATQPIPRSSAQPDSVAVPSRVWPVVAGALAVLLLIVGGLAWLWSRTQPTSIRGFAKVARFSIPILTTWPCRAPAGRCWPSLGTVRELRISQMLGSMSETSTAPRPCLSNRHVRLAVLCRVSCSRRTANGSRTGQPFLTAAARSARSG